MSLRRLGLVVCLGAGVVSGCGTGETGSTEASRAGAPRTMRDALEAGVDFAVTSLKAPAVVLPGSQLTVSVTVCNRGMEAAGTSVDLLVSSDEVASGDDTVLNTVMTGMLEAGACRVADVPVSAFVPEGHYHLLASADPGQLTPEASEANNVRDGGSFTVGFMPDFAVTAVSGPASTWSWGDVTASVTVCNQGTAGREASAFVFLSTDTDISWQDTFVAGTPVGFLAPGQCDTVSLQGMAGMPDGAYHLGALVEDGGGMVEASQANNALVGGAIGIGYGPEFVIPTVTTPASAPWGTQFPASVNLCNQGTGAGGTSFDVFLVSSPDAAPLGPPVAQGYVFLSPGDCVAQEVFVDTGASAPGTWFLRAVANSMGAPELVVSNNTTHSAAIGIGDGSDFIVSAVTAPASAQRNVPFTSSVTVCNQGTWGADVEVSVFLVSAPEEEPTGPGSSFYVGWLAPGQCVTQDASLMLDSVAQGQRYVRAIVDRGGFRYELNEGNNTRDSGAVLVQD